MQLIFSRKKLLSLLGFATNIAAWRGRSEGSLVRAAQRRDREAFRDLMNLHADSLKRFVSRRVNESDREDVLQDTWLAAWENLESFDCSDRFRTWLFSICFHKIQDHWRREHRRPPSAVYAPHDDGPSYMPREFSRVELREAMREFWESCTPEQREMLTMYYSDGLTLKEMSQVLRLNLNTVKYQFYRAHETANRALGSSIDALLASEAR